jgi:hypothetical protein
MTSLEIATTSKGGQKPPDAGLAMTAQIKKGAAIEEGWFLILCGQGRSYHRG